MALVAGIVIVSDDGTVSGVGMSRRIFDALWLAGEASMGAKPDGVSDETWTAAKVVAKRGIADTANAIALGVVGEIISTAEAVITITTSDAGLQTVAGVETEAPMSDKELTGLIR